MIDKEIFEKLPRVVQETIEERQWVDLMTYLGKSPLIHLRCMARKHKFTTGLATIRICEECGDFTWNTHMSATFQR